MPRIDPLQLLKCLGVLLTPDGGIRSKEEVQRLASLMMKFSKKLVSKCVYILILKNTETELLGMFMTAGGWTLVFTWLSDGICGKNWALVTELLELLLICPVDVERLKSNSIPRLVKGLSKDESLGGVNVLASKLVEQWLKIVKDETVPDKEITPIIKQNEIIVEVPESTISESVHEVTVDTTPIEIEPRKSLEISPQTFYKVSVRDGKQVIQKVDNEPVLEVGEAKEEIVEHEPQKEKDNKEIEIKKDERKDEKEKSKDRKKDNHSHDRSKHKSHSSSSSKSSSHSHSNKEKSSSSSRDKDRDRHKDKHRDKDKDKDKKHRDKEHRSNGSIKSSSSSNKDKEKQAEKDKATLAKLQPQSIEKLGKIPKKSSNDKEKPKSDKKSEETTHNKHKSSISIEVRKKGDGDRPKTVKVFNSKLRSTGLEEAPKPPPSRTAVKKPLATLPSVIPLKRPSPSREAPPPPEKKIKLPEPDEKQTKPGGIKLIPAKPKPAFLQESDMFMDALAASCTNKKDTKKRKRRTSVTKDDKSSHNSNSTSSPPTSPSVSNSTISPLNSPTILKSIAPKFYKDTLDTEETKTENEEKTEIKDEPMPEVKEEIKVKEEEEDDRPLENVVKEVDGLRGVLVYHKRRGPKKQVKWKVETELEEIQYFELDETERVNVTKTFTDAKQMEHTGEREALLMCRKLPSEDIMDERTTWKPLIIMDLPAALAEHGCKSSEKAIQFAREKAVLATLYFNRNMLPDSPIEADIEHQPVTDPVIIPLEDVTGNPDSVNDYQNTPWPEPKGSPPHTTNNIPNVPTTIFPQNMQPFNQQMVPPNFTGVPQGPFPTGPGFGPPNMMGGDWRPMGEGIPDGINHTPMPPFNRQENFNGIMEDGNFPPQNFGPPGPMPGPIYPGFNRGNRGGFRGMNRGGWFRPQGPPPGWHGPRGGANHWGGRGGGAGICKQFKMQGFCRNRDNCPFMHPQPNGPY